jgi:hypothetical protein
MVEFIIRRMAEKRESMGTRNLCSVANLNMKLLILISAEPAYKQKIISEFVNGFKKVTLKKGFVMFYFLCNITETGRREVLDGRSCRTHYRKSTHYFSW